MSVNGKMTAIADAIREKTGGTTLLGLDAMAEGVGAVYEAGQTEGIEQGKQELWQYVTSLHRIFHSAPFPSGYALAMDIPNRIHPDVNQLVSGAGGLRRLTMTNSPLADIKSYFAFANAADLEEIDLSNFVKGGGAVVITDASYMFYGNTAMRAVYGALDFSAGVGLDAAFANCRALEYIDITGTIGKSFNISASAVLKAEVAKNIITRLVNYAGTENAHVYSVKFNDAVWAKLDAEGATAPGDVTWRMYVDNLGWNT